MKLKNCLLILLCPLLGNAQLRPAWINDPIPAQLQTDPVFKSSTSGNNKYVLVDFWATWCMPCYAAFPKLDSIQQKHREVLSVLAVTRENKTVVDALMKKKKSLTGLSLSIATADTSWNKVFPHVGIPHIAWINSTGKVDAITAGDWVTEDNVSAWVQGKPINFPVKRDIKGYNAKQSILENFGGQALEKKVVSGRMLYKYIDGISYGTSQQVSDTGFHLLLRNFDLLRLYGMVFQTEMRNFGRHYRLRVKNPGIFKSDSPNMDGWIRNNGYSYEIVAREKLDRQQVKQYLLEDLNNSFGLEASLQKEPTTCWVLLTTGKGEKPLQTAGDKPTIEWTGESTLKRLINQPVSVLIARLNSAPSNDSIPPVFIDGSGITYNIDLSVHLGDSPSLKEFNYVLKPYGLRFAVEQCEQELLIITDKTTPNRKAFY